MAEGAAVIDRSLAALGTPVSLQLRAAILAMRQSSRLIFASTEPPPARGSLDSHDRCVTEENFCRFIGHTAASLQKQLFGVDQHKRRAARNRSLPTDVKSFGLTSRTAW